MLLQELSAISPVDGRYRNKTAALAPFFSEFGLIRYRVLVEVEYLFALAEAGIPGFDGDALKQKTAQLRGIYQNFEPAHAEQIKNTEKTTNHDVKAVEYFVKEQLDLLGLSGLREWVHFGLTSQDINNTAIPLSLKEACNQILFPELNQVCEKLKSMSQSWMQVPLLAHTHGQPASPTRLGKEIYVFVSRLEAQLEQLRNIDYSAKFGGATGNFNAHHVAYPGIDWEFFANNFVNQQLGLSRSAVTTQIEHYDNLAALFDAFRRINTILIDLCRDIWS
ncbi:MAG: adenylosuccinate lyase, partial [Bacteroidetes bacterium]|nr:adenylosuccinate lyase [Bacteroidota bacterium]